MLSQFVVLLIIPACDIVDTLENQSEGRATISVFFSRSLLFPDAYLHASGSHSKSAVLKVGVPLEVWEMQIDLWHKYADNLFDNEALMRDMQTDPLVSRHVFCLQNSNCSLDEAEDLQVLARRKKRSFLPSDSFWKRKDALIFSNKELQSKPFARVNTYQINKAGQWKRIYGYVIKYIRTGPARICENKPSVMT